MANQRTNDYGEFASFQLSLMYDDTKNSSLEVRMRPDALFSGYLSDAPKIYNVSVRKTTTSRLDEKKLQNARLCMKLANTEQEGQIVWGYR